jgi:CDP-diacylglycerol---serine O-phosphatidyltransferase
MRHIPNIITSLNLASGFIAIVFIMNGEPVAASWIILAAMVFDFLDGFASRLLHAYSDMGKELDSLADVVSFGVAPGLMIYSLLSGEMVSSSLTGKIPAIAAAAIFPVCAGLRLAKFNVDATQTVSFKGLPTPAAALAVVTVILSSAYSDSSLVRSFTGSPAAVIVFSAALSLLMVSRIPLLALKFHDLKLRGNEGRYLLIISALLIAGIFRFAGIPWIIPVYVAVSLLSLLF